MSRQPNSTPFAITLALTLSLTSASCQRYVFLAQENAVVEATKQEVTIDVPSESDILFVIDNSGSMAEEIDKTRCNIVNFVQKLSETGNKFRLAVTTTDHQDQANGDCENPPGLSGSVDTVNKRHGRCGHFLAPAGKPGFLKREDFISPQAMANEFGLYLQRDNGTITVGGSAVEQPLKSAIAALDPALRGPGGPNEGFFRDEALLLVIIISDESDCSFDPDQAMGFASGSTSGVPFGFNCYQNPAALVPPETLSDRLIALKGGQRDLIRVGLVSAATLDGAGKLVPNSCRTNDGKASDECACFYANRSSGVGSYCEFTKVKTPLASTPGGGGNVCGIPVAEAAPTNVCPVPPPSGAQLQAESNCCIALANDRLFRFTNQFENLKDTICQADFAETLIRLADLADRQCFPLEQAPLGGDPANIEIKIRRQGEEGFTLVPLTSAETPTDGWYLNATNDPPVVCLSGAFKRKEKDTISLFVVSGQTAGGELEPEGR